MGKEARVREKERIVDAVRSGLDELDGKSVSDWTKEVKTALCKACREALKDARQSVKLFASGVDDAADGGEWLFDVTCLLYDEKGFIRRVPLVAESEWGLRTAVEDDFEKLLLARADVRVMVVDRNYWDSTEDVVAELRPYVAAYEDGTPSDTYLLAAWTRDGFEYRVIDGDGSVRTLK